MTQVTKLELNLGGLLIVGVPTVKAGRSIVIRFGGKGVVIKTTRHRRRGFVCSSMS